MAKPKKSDGKTQEKMLEVFKNPIGQDVADLVLSASNLRQCDADALNQLQTAYRGQFGTNNEAADEYLIIRQKQGGKIPPVTAPIPDPAPDDHSGCGATPPLDIE